MYYLGDFYEVTAFINLSITNLVLLPFSVYPKFLNKQFTCADQRACAESSMVYLFHALGQASYERQNQVLHLPSGRPSAITGMDTLSRAVTVKSVLSPYSKRKNARKGSIWFSLRVDPFSEGDSCAGK